jgi:hypothetical protein
MLYLEDCEALHPEEDLANGQGGKHEILKVRRARILDNVCNSLDLERVDPALGIEDVLIEERYPVGAKSGGQRRRSNRGDGCIDSCVEDAVTMEPIREASDRSMTFRAVR